MHRRRTLYLIRHGEAKHNVLEAKAQDAAKREAEILNLGPEETYQKMEAARRAVLHDVSLRDAPLTDRGRQQAREAGEKIQRLISSGKVHEPTEALCSPLSRCIETCQILLEGTELNAHIRHEITERQTQLPPDTPRSLIELLRTTRDDERFVVNHLEKLSHSMIEEEDDEEEEEACTPESKRMLRERANKMFDLLMELEHRHIIVVSHKGFLRELERGLFQIPDSPLFGNCELRVYRVCFTKGDRSLSHVERLDDE